MQTDGPAAAEQFLHPRMHVEVKRLAAQLEPLLDAVARDIVVDHERQSECKGGISTVHSCLVREPPRVEGAAPPATGHHIWAAGPAARSASTRDVAASRIATANPSGSSWAAVERFRNAVSGGGSDTRVATISRAHRSPPST